MTPDEEKQFVAFFERLGEAARAVAMTYFRREIPVDDKQDASPVTQADREIEQKLRAMITEAYPAHGIIGEEFGSERVDADYVWVVDPIDGTKSFITGRPLFGTIIGLMYRHKPVMGLIDQAFTQERWFGVADRYATHNGQVIKVGAARSLPQARLYTGSISMFDGPGFEAWLTLCRSVKLAQYSCDCYAYGLLAMGWADVAVECRLKIYDVAGVVPIITGAGGFAGDWELNSGGLGPNGEFVAASSRELAAAAVAIVKGHE